MRFTSLSAIVLSSVCLVACGSSSDTPPPAGNDAGGDTPTDTNKPDVKPVEGGDTGGDTTPPPDISGALDISIRVIQYENATTKTPLPDFPIRAENAAGGFLESKTGADGVGHLKVDAAKGPFDITIAKAGYGIVSILGVTGPVGDVSTYELGTASKTATIGGTITGKVDPANQVQVDAWAFSTFIAKSGITTYSSKYSYNDVTKDPPIPLAAIEVDSTGKAINGVLTASTPRTGTAMTTNVVLPSPAVAATAKTINAKFPATGLLTGSALTKISKPTSDTFLGDALVVKSSGFAQMFVGIGNSAIPSSNAAAIKLQVFGGDMAPDKVVAAWSGTGNLYARINFSDLADGATVTMGEVKTLEQSGLDLSDYTFSIDGTGYEFSGMELIDTSANSVVWRAYQAGGKIASRGLPHLPTTVKMEDVAAGFAPVPVVVLFKKATGGSIWGDSSDDYVVSVTGDGIDGAGR